MLTSLSMGGADILLELYKKGTPAVSKKYYFLKDETSEVKNLTREVLMSFISL